MSTAARFARSVSGQYGAVVQALGATVLTANGLPSREGTRVVQRPKPGTPPPPCDGRTLDRARSGVLMLACWPAGKPGSPCADCFSPIPSVSQNPAKNGELLAGFRLGLRLTLAQPDNALAQRWRLGCSDASNRASRRNSGRWSSQHLPAVRSEGQDGLQRAQRRPICAAPARRNSSLAPVADSGARLPRPSLIRDGQGGRSPPSGRANRHPMGGRLHIGMADITSERVADFIPELLAMIDLFDCCSRICVIYSSNCVDAWKSKHVLHRKFSTWVKNERPSWYLLERMQNPFLYSQSDPEQISFADFYVCGRDVE